MEEVSFKILILGDTTVGKTSFMTRYIEDKFTITIQTVGIDSRSKTLERNNKKVYLQIFDTAGQERYRSIVKNLYKGADGIILMYDVTKKNTFNSIKNWIKSINDNKDLNEIGLIIVGNKIDLPDKIISDEDKEELENSLNIKIIEASARENINVNESIEKLVDLMMEINSKNDKKEETVKKNSVKLDKNGIKKKDEKKTHCCS